MLWPVLSLCSHPKPWPRGSSDCSWQQHWSTVINTERDFTEKSYPFSKTTAGVAPLGPVTSPIHLWLGIQYQMWIVSWGAGIRSYHKVVGYPITDLPLLHQGAYLTQLFSAVIHKAHNWVETVDNSSHPTVSIAPSSPPGPRGLLIREEASSHPVSTRLLYVLWPKYMAFQW